MPTRKKTTKTKRAVSGERSIALALVEVIERFHELINLASPETQQSLSDAVARADKTLDTHGYAGLESISSRVSKLETAINEAVANRDGKEIARLGAELNRAQRGLPPVVKKAKVEKQATAAAGQ